MKSRRARKPGTVNVRDYMKPEFADHVTLYQKLDSLGNTLMRDQVFTAYIYPVLVALAHAVYNNYKFNLNDDRQTVINNVVSHMATQLHKYDNEKSKGVPFRWFNTVCINWFLIRYKTDKKYREMFVYGDDTLWPALEKEESST